ncbi:MAG TPA: prepilin-type N-terminal cleavage/methylation domain-containing protein [Actinomycetota bacterium]|nr:prepilin-type N-terminal cleavage/methylation domain-containing protein [Actinomycetota bacterium]
MDLRRLRDEQGFTLIELLMVIVILGILAGVAAFAVAGVTDRGSQSACKADVKSVQVASDAYYAKQGSYAASVDELVSAGFLRSKPNNPKYTVTYNSADGSVGSNPSCTSV